MERPFCCCNIIKFLQNDEICNEILIIYYLSIVKIYVSIDKNIQIFTSVSIFNNFILSRLPYCLPVIVYISL